MHVWMIAEVNGPLWSNEQGRPAVELPARAATGSGEARRGFGREIEVGLPEVGQAPRCLFEVVADDLVALDQFPALLGRARERSVGAALPCLFLGRAS